MPARYKTLQEAMQALAGLTDVNRSKALQARGVDWSLGENTPEAELARHMANHSGIFDAHNGVSEARRAAEIGHANKREPWAKRVASGR